MPVARLIATAPTDDPERTLLLWTARPCGDLLSYVCALQHKLWRHHRKEGINLDRDLTESGPDLMRTERPYPGQLWKHDSLRVIVVAVSPNTVTYEDLSGRAGVTRDSLSKFLDGFTRLKSPVR